MSLTVCMGLLSCCFQSIFKKSIFTISGAAQAAAGIYDSTNIYSFMHAEYHNPPANQFLCMVT